MFPLNTILAWNINTYHEQGNMIITILLLPLGHISNSLPLALESIIQFTLVKIQHPWPSGADHVLLVEEVFSQRSDMLRTVCNLQFICVSTQHSSQMSWYGIVYVWSSGETLIPRSKICYQYCHTIQLHSSDTLGTTPSSKELFDSNTLLSHCQNNDILSLRLQNPPQCLELI